MSRRLAHHSLFHLPPPGTPSSCSASSAQRIDGVGWARRQRGLIAFVSNAGMCPPRFLTYELPAKITSMPYIHAGPPCRAEEPMVIKFWEHPRPAAILVSCLSRRSYVPGLTYHRGERERVASTSGFRRLRSAQRGGSRYFGNKMLKNFYESFSLRFTDSCSFAQRNARCCQLDERDKERQSSSLYGLLTASWRIFILLLFRSLVCF